jgi:hypothetical protein
MTAVMVEIGRRPSDIGRRPGDTNTPQGAGDDRLEYVPDLDIYLEHVMCSCNASDDNPY